MENIDKTLSDFQRYQGILDYFKSNEDRLMQRDNINYVSDIIHSINLSLNSHNSESQNTIYNNMNLYSLVDSAKKVEKILYSINNIKEIDEISKSEKVDEGNWLLGRVPAIKSEEGKVLI